MDWRDLLVKYIRYVGQCEGVDFIEGGYRCYVGQRFSPEEWEALEVVSAEASDDGLG